MSLLPDLSLHPDQLEQPAYSSSASANTSSSALAVAEPPMDSTLRNLTAVFANATDALRTDLGAVAANASAIVANTSLRTLGNNPITSEIQAAEGSAEAIHDGFQSILNESRKNPNAAAGIIDTDMDRHWITVLVIASVMIAALGLACLTSFLAPTGQAISDVGGGDDPKDTKK